jgi:hypothetical protein
MVSGKWLVTATDNAWSLGIALNMVSEGVAATWRVWASRESWSLQDDAPTGDVRSSFAVWSAQGDAGDDPTLGIALIMVSGKWLVTATDNVGFLGIAAAVVVMPLSPRVRDARADPTQPR